MLTTVIKGHPLAFETAPSLFSPGQIDKGTLAMLKQIEFSPDDKVLDLGCGYGVVGIVAAKYTPPSNIFMSDNDKIAIKYAKKNTAHNNIQGINIIHSNAYENINESGFTIIASNPPYHADFSVPKLFIEKGFNRLAIGGKFYMVTKRKDWYKNKFISIFGGVRIHEADGYYIFEAEKRSHSYRKKA
ncbi:MAG: methyltransferase [Defluviitaleaceae bacterium]|nr:methyltransferase [Defluviitaleaceae bacterium]